MSNNKQSMKLYTEEEIMNYLTNHKSTITRYDVQNIPSIELPSDLLCINCDDSPQKNGVECPICKNELIDTNSMMTLTSNPPKKNVHCPKCDYIGYRYC